MNSLESVRSLIVHYLKGLAAAPIYGIRRDPSFIMFLVCEKDLAQKVYNAFFNFLSDPTQSPESILHLLDTYTNGLDGFSSNESLQTVVGFACFEALAIRRPDVVNGPWETLLWVIVNYLSIANGKECYGLPDYREPKKATPKFIADLSSPELCPNPCLRLEIFRFMRSFDCKELYDSYESYRNNVIKTLFEICDNYTSLSVDQLPNFSPIDLRFVVEDSSINIEYIMHECKLETRKVEIIATVLKLTRNLALLEKKKYVDDFHRRSLDFEKELSACLSFGGLSPQDGIFNKVSCHNFLQVIGNNSFLLNSMIDTLDTIQQILLCFPEMYNYTDLLLYQKDKLLDILYKRHIKKVPTFQYNLEIHGGITPAAEYRLRYFQNI